MELPACRNRSNTNGRNTEEMPMPLSVIDTSASPSTSRRLTSTCPPFGVNLSAFDTRFQAICWRRSRSPTTMMSRSNSRVTMIDFAAAAGISESMASSMIACIAGLAFSRHVPAKSEDVRGRV